MHLVEPAVYLVSATMSLEPDLLRYLDDVGGGDWLDRRFADESNDADLLTEFAGRICYRSWEPQLNPNLTRVRQDQRAYLANLVGSGHTSTLEHVVLGFVLHNVSRVFTHELVRHRVGTAVSQESLRYVRLTDTGFWEDPILAPETLASGRALIEQFESWYRDAVAREGLDGASFARKKAVTSALRRYSPAGLATGVYWSCNLRELRHIIVLRTAPEAEAEMRRVFDRVAAVCRDAAPGVFDDLLRLEDGTWRPA